MAYVLQRIEGYKMDDMVRAVFLALTGVSYGLLAAAGVFTVLVSVR